MYSKILVPLDGSKTAEKVLPYARYLADKFKVPVAPQNLGPRRTWGQVLQCNMF
jgi:nucleotide-binding universal stress UspA family protein